jgi:hypothetical protein
VKRSDENAQHLAADLDEQSREAFVASVDAELDSWNDLLDRINASLAALRAAPRHREA